ncbi:uncharacterized protein [Haliotis asinina]|uniref:uncharacterized protein n=1 Tax=Haliotis asinina TaxID=109174 RepID=UPI003531B3CB
MYTVGGLTPQSLPEQRFCHNGSSIRIDIVINIFINAMYILAVVMLCSLICHCEARQCTITEGTVVKINITCSTGCCLDGSGVRCCGDTTIKTTNKMDSSTRGYSGVASPEMNTFQLILFACLAMLAVPQLQWLG